MKEKEDLIVPPRDRTHALDQQKGSSPKALHPLTDTNLAAGLPRGRDIPNSLPVRADRLSYVVGGIDRLPTLPQSHCRVKIECLLYIYLKSLFQTSPAKRSGKVLALVAVLAFTINSELG